MLRKIGLLLIQIYRMQAEIYWCMPLKVKQNIQHGIGIFATRQTNHDQIAIFDHIVIGNGATDFPPEILATAV